VKVTSYSAPTYRDWSWETPNTTGIGGSETAAIEMAGRLAMRGHDVLVYAPTPWRDGVWETYHGGVVVREQRTDPRGAVWAHSDYADTRREGFWIINRCPDILDKFPVDHPDQQLYFLAEDTFYQSMTEDRAAKLDKYICLCQAHANYVASIYPYLKDQLVLGSNGIKMETIREIEKGPPERNPRRLMFASSPDRGLLPLLKIFKRAREWVSGADGNGPLELHVYYGFQNLLKSCEGQGEKHPAYRLYKKCMKEMDQPGVYWHDRTPQPELYRDWFKSGIFCTPSTFTETNFISCQEAQACGAIPIALPIWAASDFIRHGTFLHGDPYEDPLTQARFVGEIYRLASNPKLQEQIRAEMMPYARSRFNWERSIDTIEAWMHGYDDGKRMIMCQGGYSLKHAKGKILNVGCCDDGPNLKALGAINMDIHAVDPALNRPNAVDVVADARSLPAPFEPHSFDCVVMTEVLEHFETNDVPEQLRKLKKCLRPGGHIVITVPDDHRELQGQSLNGHSHYADGISFKHHPVSKETFYWWANESGLEVTNYQQIEYGFDDVMGHAGVLVPWD
jgi:glycosyltransferase involved in cell wall biosynthesis